MDEATFGVVLGLCVSLAAIIWHIVESATRKIDDKITASISQIEAKTFDIDLPNVDEMRDAVEDIIQEQLSAMRTPQIADHLGAILQQWAQVKMQKDLMAMQQTKTLVEDTLDKHL